MLGSHPTRDEVSAEYQRIKKLPLNEIKAEEIEALCRQKSALDLYLQQFSYEVGFPENLKAFASLRSARREDLDRLREDYVINSLLEASCAVSDISPAPSLNFRGLRFTELPYKRLTSGHYHYNRFSFVGSKLHHRALINVIKGGADVRLMDWAHVGPENTHIYYSESEKAGYLLLQELIAAAYALQASLNGAQPKGLRALFDEVITPNKDVFDILKDLSAHLKFKRASPPLRCFHSVFRGRAAAVEHFYQEWSRRMETLSSVEPTEKTGLLRG